MANPRKPADKKPVEAIRHKDDSRRNIPTAEQASFVSDAMREPVTVAYARRNRDLDPQLMWRGKDELDAPRDGDAEEAYLVTQAPPLYTEEKISPKALIDDLMRYSAEAAEADPGDGYQTDLFSDFNGLPSENARTEFYQHDMNWSNRMILGDSLQAMTSLAEREELRGKVQCVYIDPPYGIRFNSNFQWSVTSRDVRDGNREHITREPEQVKAFRDTWRDGVHSYLTYLRDRLTAARDLLADSGSCFVQIGDENVHRVRVVMDEVFGDGNFMSQISFTKTSSFSTNYLANITDHILWYSKNINATKYRQLTYAKEAGKAGATSYRPVDSIPGKFEIFEPSRLASSDQLNSQGGSAEDREISIMGRTFPIKSGMHWKTAEEGMQRLSKAARLGYQGNTPRYLRFLEDFPMVQITNQWNDTGVAGYAANKTYVVQTLPKVVERCILMATDPGDLVLDPTCGSGTTAYVAEQWGRRWITIDTSRVALALARARLMGARYPYYLLADSPEGRKKEAEVTGRISSSAATYGDVRQGFVYERVPHIMLGDIANNAEIDTIWEAHEPRLSPLLAA